MADAKPNATLVGLRGPRKGKKYTLGDAEFRIGREASCEIVLHDDFVAPVHTVIEPRGGLWAAVNRGMNGTLVNGARIEGARTLAPGDQVQIGAEAVFEFRVTEPKGKRILGLEAPPIPAYPTAERKDMLLVASQPLPAGHVITESDLFLVEVPATTGPAWLGCKPGTCFRNYEEVVGRTVAEDILDNAAIRREKLK